MKLKDLLEDIVDVSSTIDIQGIALDSRKVEKGFLFIALSGSVQHGLTYVAKAIENGASAVIYEKQGSENFELTKFNCVFLEVDGLASKISQIADCFYQSPSRYLDVIGITGTNGKTTCSQFLMQLMPNSGVIGTLGWGGTSTLQETQNTTPDAVSVQAMLAEFVEQEKQTVMIEVSSHGLQQQRVKAVRFKEAVFTNLSRDHLDYHGSIHDYLNAKLMLFKQTGLEFTVVNADDEYSEQFLKVTQVDVKHWAFSTSGKRIESAENVIADEIQCSLDGIIFNAHWNQDTVKVQTSIVGDFNVENILAAMTVLLSQGYSLKTVGQKVAELLPVAGRMQKVSGENKPYVFIDYAHTPDALEKLLKGLSHYCQNKLRLVFGCGGDRDRGKRSQMGAVAEKYADQMIITNDNPRSEKPETIINEITKGCLKQSYEIILDREQAIQTVIQQADKMDCIVIAGKGHEDYQEINGVKHPFSDQAVAQQALSGWVS